MGIFNFFYFYEPCRVLLLAQDLILSAVPRLEGVLRLGDISILTAGQKLNHNVQIWLPQHPEMNLNQPLVRARQERTLDWMAVGSPGRGKFN